MYMRCVVSCLTTCAFCACGRCAIIWNGGIGIEHTSGEGCKHENYQHYDGDESDFAMNESAYKALPASHRQDDTNDKCCKDA